MIRPGISSFTYGWNIGVEGHMPETPMDETILVNQAVAFGMDCVQIGDNLPLHTFDLSRKQRLKKLIREKNIRLEIGARKLDVDNLARYIELANYFESPLLRFVIDSDGYEPDISTVIKIIQRALPELAEKQIVLGIENHDRFKAAELAEIMKTVDHHHLGICLDCVNSMGAGEGLEQVASVLAPYTVNLHIKDFSIKRLSHKMGFLIQGEIAGKGMLQLPWLLEKVNAYGRCETAVLEQWVPPESDVFATCQKEKEWASAGIKYLQSVLNKIQ